MTIEEIRNSFSKAHMLITKTGISFSFPAGKDGWFLQSIPAKALTMLVGNCSSVVIECAGNLCTNVSFAMSLNVGIPRCYISTWREPSLEQIREFCIGREIEPKIDEFLVDLSEDSSMDDIMNAFSEFMTARAEFEPPAEHSAGNWEWLFDCVTSFANMIDAEFEIMQPDDHCDGSVTVYLMERNPGKLIIEGKELRAFLNVVEGSSTIDFEGNPDENIFNATFYV